MAISQDDSNILRSPSNSQEFDCIEAEAQAILHTEASPRTRSIQTRKNLISSIQTIRATSQLADSNGIEATNSLVQAVTPRSRSIQTRENLVSSFERASSPIENFNQTIRLRDHEDREVVLSVSDIAAASIPIVQEMNVSDNSRVHFGPEFHSIEKTVYTEEVIKGRVLGIELTTPKKSTSVRCGIIVFVICALVVGSGMIHHYVKYGIVQQKNPIIDLDIHEWWYIRRPDWQARPSFKTVFLRLPVRFVIISHSQRESCEGRQTCIEEVQSIQYRDQNIKNLDDIAANFIITREGLVFEGRGTNIEGDMVPVYDFNSITIKFLGDYRTNRTIPEQFYHMNDLLRELVRKGILRRDYDVAGHCQIDPRVESPGKYMMLELGHLTRWWSHNWELCFKRIKEDIFSAPSSLIGE